MTEPRDSLRVLLTCSGVGIMNRGIESFFREAFNGLKHTDGLQLRLLKGAGARADGEGVLWNLARTAPLARLLGRILQRNAYVIEQWSCFPAVAREIRSFRPRLVFYSDANLGFLLYRLRDRIGVPYNLLFSNGGPAHAPFVRTDYVHQVAPAHYQEAIRAGEPSGKHFLVPYGINVVPIPETLPFEERKALRQRLGMPMDHKIVISVGWIRRVHKRMDYVISEIASLSQPRPFLQLVGAIDEESAEVIALGKRLLGANGFAAHSVSWDQVFDYYRAADCFVLASLEEGFGRVYLEALMHGLPVIAHRNPITEYVLGNQATLANLRDRGALAPLLIRELQKPPGTDPIRDRWASVRDRFGWEVLAPLYRDMFEACAGSARSPKHRARLLEVVLRHSP